MKRSWKDWLLRNYHWVIFGAVFIEYTVSIGLANNIYSLFIIPVTQTFGITRGTFSIASSIKYIAAFCSNLTFGLLYRQMCIRDSPCSASIRLRSRLAPRKDRR